MNKIIVPEEAYKTNKDGEVTLQLKTRNDFTSISKASGKRVTASKLEVNKTYLHKNTFIMRTIIAINNKRVWYFDGYGPMTYCSTTHFAITCPHEATTDEMEFLLREQRDDKRYSNFNNYKVFADGIYGHDFEIIQIINKLK